MSNLKWIERVPKNVPENLVWRHRLWKAAARDRGLRKAIIGACFEDVLFWFNAVCWCFEPRSVHKIRPFVTWSHQDPVLIAMDDAITESEHSEDPVDLTLDKSRGQGATWMYLLVFLRRWLRDPLFSVGLVTRNEDLVDSKTDPDTLLWKIDWELKQLPFWMLPPGFDFREHRSLSEHTIVNPDLGGTFAGYSATGDVGRGGRKTVFGIDEFGSEEFIRGGKDYSVLGSTQHVTNCRFLVSTYGADTGAFYEAATGESSSRVVILDWKDNPTQNRLMYTVDQGKPKAKKRSEQNLVRAYHKKYRSELKLLERKGHKFEGKERSPWYDKQCLRPGATPKSIGKELDRNPRGAIGKLFDEDVLDRMKRQKVRRPLWQGRPIIDQEENEVVGFVRGDDGPLKLWFLPGLDVRAPHGRYAVGCDLAAGTGGPRSSNSTAIGVDKDTGEQVLEYVTHSTIPTLFARVVVPICKWLKGAFLAWEATGPSGSGFGKEVIEELHYGYHYKRRKISKYGPQTSKPGWWNTNDDAKATLFDQMLMGMKADEFTPRSADLIRECGEYEWDQGKIIHKLSKTGNFDGQAHGDRCVGAAVAWLAVCDEKIGNVDKDDEDSEDVPYGSFAWREQQERARERDWRSDDAPMFTLKDLMAEG